MSDKITIQELGERKEKLRESIKQLVDEFAEETGTRPKIEIGLSTAAKIFGSASYAVSISIRV